MKKITGLLLLAALGLVPVVASAAEIEGVLLDQACASGDGLKDGQKGALKHERDCALMDACAKSGFGIVTADDKYLKFDSAGNQKALALLQKTTQKDNLRMKVTGDVTGDQIAVQSIALE
jgi:hypothetical protein